MRLSQAFDEARLGFMTKLLETEQRLCITSESFEQTTAALDTCKKEMDALKAIGQGPWHFSPLHPLHFE